MVAGSIRQHRDHRIATGDGMIGQEYQGLSRRGDLNGSHAQPSTEKLASWKASFVARKIFFTI